MLTIGRAQKPHGVKGVIKAQSFMDSPYELAKIEKTEIDGKEYLIEDIKITPKTVLIKFEGVDTMEAADALRNKELKIKREFAPPPEEGRYYVKDLLGANVYIDGKLAGELADIMQYGSADVYQIKGEKNFMFPFAGDVVKKIDIDKKEIFLNAKELQKVAVYED